MIRGKHNGGAELHCIPALRGKSSAQPEDQDCTLWFVVLLEERLFTSANLVNVPIVLSSLLTKPRRKALDKSEGQKPDSELFSTRLWRCPSCVG